MSLRDSYLEIAKRKLDASEACLNKGVQESAGFLAYHSFESAGGALCEANSIRYPKNHKKKLNKFKVLANRLSNGRTVATLAIELISLRNEFLYPEILPDGSIKEPKDVMTLTESRDMRRRVKGIVVWVERIV